MLRTHQRNIVLLFVAAALLGVPGHAADKPSLPTSLDPATLKPGAILELKLPRAGYRRVNSADPVRACIWLPDNFDSKQTHPVWVHLPSGKSMSKAQLKTLRSALGADNWIFISVDRREWPLPTGLIEAKAALDALGRVCQIHPQARFLSATGQAADELDQLIFTREWQEFPHKVFWGGGLSESSPLLRMAENRMLGGSGAWLFSFHEKEDRPGPKRTPRLQVAQALGSPQNPNPLPIALNQVAGKRLSFSKNGLIPIRNWATAHHPILQMASEAIRTYAKAKSPLEQKKIRDALNNYAWFQHPEMQQALQSIAP